MTSLSTTPVEANTPEPGACLVGLEIGPALIRAGIFTSSLELMGKAKLSTKLERGPAAVIERAARCVEYAIDECDLPTSRIRGIGVGTPGQIAVDAGEVVSAEALTWKDIPLRSALEKLLLLPVFVENQFRLATLGVITREFGPDPRRFAALFLGPEIGGGFIAKNELLDAAEFMGIQRDRSPAQDGVFAIMPHEEFRHARVRDLRKTARKGNPAIREYIRAIAARAGEVAVELQRTFQPDVIILGGGLMDEMREEIVGIVDGVLGWSGADAPVARAGLFCSLLGDLACMTGGAAIVARKLAGQFPGK